MVPTFSFLVMFDGQKEARWVRVTSLRKLGVVELVGEIDRPAPMFKQGDRVWIVDPVTKVRGTVVGPSVPNGREVYDVLIDGGSIEMVLHHSTLTPLSVVDQVGEILKAP
jgi:hypothetical protein